ISGNPSGAPDDAAGGRVICGAQAARPSARAAASATEGRRRSIGEIGGGSFIETEVYASAPALIPRESSIALGAARLIPAPDAAYVERIGTASCPSRSAEGVLLGIATSSTRQPAIDPREAAPIDMEFLAHQRIAVRASAQAFWAPSWR